jgi:predicted secreted protein
MLKKLLALFFLCSLISCIDLTEYEVIPINGNSNGQLLKFSQTKKFAFELSGNPSTGFNWFLSNAEELKQSNLLCATNLSEKFTGEFVRNNVPDAGFVGVGGKIYFTFSGNGNGAGLVNINLEYKRPWENNAVRKVSVKVELV